MGSFGATICSYCGKGFERVRRYQHLCSRVCHYNYFVEERRLALAAWRSNKRMLMMVAQQAHDDDVEAA